MDDTAQSGHEELLGVLDAGGDETAGAALAALETAPVKERKRALQELRTLADDRPTVVAPLAAELEAFLTDEERSVRLSAAKLFATLADAEPDAISDCVPALAERLADDEEFYYVRGRAAEAIGYVAVDHPDVITPEILADLRVGLTFDRPEVRQKLATALAAVALGDPDRLRHHVTDLADNLAADDEFVRYQLSTALVAVGCGSAAALLPAADSLVDRLDDDSPYVRGRAAEALGLLARAGGEVPASARDGLEAVPPESESANDAAAAFLQDRLRFAAAASHDQEATVPDGVGSLQAITDGHAEIVEAITTPDGGCPNCGRSLPPGGPPVCPRCGVPSE